MINNSRSSLCRRVPEAGDHCGDGGQRWQGVDTLHGLRKDKRGEHVTVAMRKAMRAEDYRDKSPKTGPVDHGPQRSNR